MSELNQTSRLIELISPLIAPLGYEIVHLEMHLGRQKILRLFIDFRESREGRNIGIEDCVAVTRALSAPAEGQPGANAPETQDPLDAIPEFAAIFKGPYELEVSSPGVDRPLRTANDFARFSGRDARIHVYRPLTADELSNPNYQQKNPKQKNFVGTIQGFQNERVFLDVSPSGTQKISKPKAKAADGKKDAARLRTNSVEVVSIPLPLISKANLEPVFEFPAESKERE